MSFLGDRYHGVVYHKKGGKTEWRPFNQSATIMRDDLQVINRRWVFIWTSHSSIDYFTFSSRFMGAMARKRKLWHGASIDGLTQLEDNPAIPENIIAIIGVIYFPDRAHTGRYAKRYLQSVIRNARVGGDIFTIYPDRPLRQKGMFSQWRTANTATEQVYAGARRPGWQTVYPFWDVTFGAPRTYDKTPLQRFYGDI